MASLQSFQNWTSGWLDRRIPSANEITLTQRRIFIFPTRAGLGYLVLVVGLLIAGINYENNMLFGIAFLLLGLFLVSILHTYTNLSGLTLIYSGAEATFCPQFAEFRFLLSRNTGRSYHAIELGWPDQATVTASLVDKDETKVSVYFPTRARGRLLMKRLKVQSRYPLGLMRAWTWLDFNASCLIYPEPAANAEFLADHARANENGQFNLAAGNEEFAGLDDYRAGDSLKLIAWKSIARGLPPMTKQYRSMTDRELWITWSDSDATNVEAGLSRMCALVLAADSRELAYGLVLPGTEVQPALGTEHKRLCLTALAEFSG